MNRRLNEWSGMLLIVAALSMIGVFRASALVIDGFEPDEQMVYKTIGTTELKLHVFNPENHNPSDQRPAIVFFFGGGWVGGSPTQFHPQCEYLASRGMVAMSAEYRVESVHGTTPRECVQDGKSAIRWIRTHASELGINPDQIAAGGGSAGGQIAAAAGTISGFEEEGEDLAISSCPDALVLFNPVYDNGPTGWGYDKVQDYWEDFSPMHNISETTPPTVVFLGTEDALIPVATAEEYKSRMELLGLRNDLYLYEGQGHGFFNYNEESYSETLVDMDDFLVSLGLLTPATLFTGGVLGTASDWTDGLPGSGNPGTVVVDGSLGNTSQAGQLFSGATVTVGSGATLSGGIDFPAAGGNTWIINDATVNLSDDFFSNDSFFILNEGSSVNAADGFTGQGDGGNITINGGSHTAAGNNEGTGFGTSPSPRTSTLNFLGGNVVAGSFGFKNGLVTIGGTAVATATGTTPTADAQGNVNVLSDWTGWLRADSFTGSTWSNVVVGNWTLDGTPIDGTLFDANFIVSADGKTVSLTALPDPEPVSRLRVFLLGGQSNADGRADPSGQPTYTDIDFYSDTETRSGALTGLYPGSSETSQFGPELTFGRRLSDILACDSSNRLAIIKYANGGTDLKYEWKAGGDATTTGDGTEYVAFQQAVSDGLAALATQYTGAVINIEGMIWMQGERDAVQGYTNDYQANMTAFIADVRTTYGTNLPFVIGRLSDVQTAISVSSLEAIQAAQSAAAASDYRTGLVETDDLSIKTDNIHFDAAGQLELGRRFAVEMAYLLWVKSQLTSADIDAGKGEPNADPDMDGIVNMDEFISGTDVAVSNSMFLVSMDIIGSNVIEIQHFPHSGRLYQVESCSNLVDQVWISHAVFTNDISGLMTHTITNSLPTSFFRVRAALP